jgi:hypothetical protein
MAEDKQKDGVRKTWEQIIADHPEFNGVINQKSWDFIGHSDKRTVDYLKKGWTENVKENVRNKLWKRFGGLADDCVGIGRNKAVIGVGAGQSFNQNKNILRELHDIDGTKPWKDRNFIIMASNHQYKPLLNMGIIPDFVVLADGSDVVVTQLLEDIPDKGRNTVLLAGLHCSPSVLRRWKRQGREIRFYASTSEGFDKIFKNLTGKEAEPYKIMQGGNVLNSAWSIGLKYFGSSVFIALGNDLSFPIKDTIEDQRKSYYADGDYSSNAPKTGTGRDEAKTQHKWMGFTLKDRHIYTGDFKKRYNVEIEPVGTNQNLWVYKTWVEANVLGMATKLQYHYYNCSEGGIAGVMCKDDSDKGLAIEDNWFLMDEVCKRWKTRKLKDAVSEFLLAKEAMWQRNPFINARTLDAPISPV